MCFMLRPQYEISQSIELGENVWAHVRRQIIVQGAWESCARDVTHADRQVWWPLRAASVVKALRRTPGRA